MRAESRQKPPLELLQGQVIPLLELLQQMEPNKTRETW